MDLEEAREKFEQLDTDDVAQKRFEMFKIFEALIEKEVDSSNPSEQISELKDSNGYFYKLSQDFLLSSSTMEKEQILGKIVDYAGRE